MQIELFCLIHWFCQGEQGILHWWFCQTCLNTDVAIHAVDTCNTPFEVYNGRKGYYISCFAKPGVTGTSLNGYGFV